MSLNTSFQCELMLLLLPLLPLLLLCTWSLQVGAKEDDLDNLLHKCLNAGLSTFCIAQALLLVSCVCSLPAPMTVCCPATRLVAHSSAPSSVGQPDCACFYH